MSRRPASHTSAGSISLTRLVSQTTANPARAVEAAIRVLMQTSKVSGFR
jgi:hypothetical protein